MEYVKSLLPQPPSDPVEWAYGKWRAGLAAAAPSLPAAAQPYAAETQRYFDTVASTAELDERNTRLAHRIAYLEASQRSNRQRHVAEVVALEDVYTARQQAHEGAAGPVIEVLDRVGIGKLVYDELRQTVENHAVGAQRQLMEEKQSYSYLGKGVAYYAEALGTWLGQMRTGEPFQAAMHAASAAELDEVPRLVEQLTEAAAVGMPSASSVHEAATQLLLTGADAALTHTPRPQHPSLLDSLRFAAPGKPAEQVTAEAETKGSATLRAAAQDALRSARDEDYPAVLAALDRAPCNETATVGDALAECRRGAQMRQAGHVAERYAAALATVKAYAFVEGMFRDADGAFEQ